MKGLLLLATAVCLGLTASADEASDALADAEALVEKLRQEEILKRQMRDAEPSLVTESGNVRIVVGEGKHISINVGGVETNLDELDNNMKALDKAALTDSTAAMLLGYQLGNAMNETRSEIKAQNIAKLQEDLSDIDTAVKAQKKLIEDGVQTDINTILDEVAAMQVVLGSAGPAQCVPGVEYQTKAGTEISPPECKYISHCQSGKYLSSPATRTSDITCTDFTTCKSTEYTSFIGSALVDRKCTTIKTKCADNEYEVAAPTKLSDRVCVVATCKTLGDGPLPGGGYCVAGTGVGGDGSSKDKAGKSCFTIRHGWGQKTDAAYWVYFDESPASAWRVYCDMNQCGRDKSDEWKGKDQSGCGGWTLALKAPGARANSNCLNKRDVRWRNGAEFGDTTSISTECAKGPAFKKTPFTDVMMRSLLNKPENVAWRHMEAAGSLHTIIAGCIRKHDGHLIVPGYIPATFNQQLTSLMYIDWYQKNYNTAHGGDRKAPAGTFHSTCVAEQRWGFFMQDYMGGVSTAGCSITSGGGGGVIGMANYNWNRQYTYEQYGHTTNCLSAYVFGGGYGSGTESGTTAYSSHQAMHGHWWGHGGSHNHANGHGIFIRDIRDIPGVATQKQAQENSGTYKYEQGVFSQAGGGHVCKGCRDGI